jgi:hypothetical protein
VWSGPKLYHVKILFLGVLKRRSLDLIIKVAAFGVANEVGANVLIAGRFRGLCLMFETIEECLCNTLVEIDTKIFCNHLRPDIFRKLLIPNAQDIKPYAFRATGPQGVCRLQFRALCAAQSRPKLSESGHSVLGDDRESGERRRLVAAPCETYVGDTGDGGNRGTSEKKAAGN